MAAWAAWRPAATSHQQRPAMSQDRHACFDREILDLKIAKLANKV
jgi:hypothetical protein